MALPEGFLREIGKYPELRVLETGLLEAPQVSVRRNTRKSAGLHAPEAPEAPDAAGIAGLEQERVPWCAEGSYLPERPSFTFDPAMHQGLYYVQDASSMSIGAAIRQVSGDAPLRYLDACAAPGGKTTAAIDALPEGSVVVANEYDYRRAEILAENVSKWGYPDVVVTKGDTSRLGRLRGFFDIVAVDAPCSGEGMMRKDPDAVAQWSERLVESCAATQREILGNVWESLRPGGWLVYSTCTFNRRENEENLAWLVESLGAESVAIDALEAEESIAKGIGTPYHCYRFLPGKTRGEGLFLALVRKPGDSKSAPVKAKPQKAPVDTREIAGWTLMPMDYMVADGEIYGLPQRSSQIIRHVASALNTVQAGVHIGSVKGRDIKPAHELALSQALNREAFAVCDLDYGQAVRYLQKESITLPDSAPKANVLLTYRGVPLGFVKNLGNRCNSMMPKQWRILSRR